MILWQGLSILSSFWSPLFFIGSSPENVVFVNNPTTAINTVMNCLSLTEEDVILCNSHTYPAILNTIDFSAKKWNAQIHSIPLKLPITSEEQVVNVSDTWMLRRRPHHSKNQGSLNFFGGAESYYELLYNFFWCRKLLCFFYIFILHFYCIFITNYFENF